jgi:tetratricopeptide (TPR) repeat protein
MAQDNSDDLVDHISLATLMIYDAKYDKARNELRLVSPTASYYDAAKFYTVSGVLESKLEHHNEAIFNYRKAIEATEKKVFLPPKIYTKQKHLFSIGGSEDVIEKEPDFDPEKVKKEKIEKLYIYLSQAYYKAKEYKNSVEALDLAGELGRNRASLYAFRADCYWKIEEHANAFNALNLGIKRFDDASLLKQKFYYFSELKLYLSAVETSMAYMKKVGQNEEDFIALAQMLISADQTHEAIKVLEHAKLAFPKNAKIGALLAHTYLKKEMPYSGASLLEYSSYYDEKYLKDSIEVYRRVKNYPHAIYLNSLMLDKVEKLKQRVAIYIDRGEFEKVIGLKDALNRYSMLDDDNLRYAMAYAYYMAKDYKTAEEHLKKISDNELFTKATVIRKNIEKCQDNSMECI